MNRVGMLKRPPPLQRSFSEGTLGSAEGKKTDSPSVCPVTRSPFRIGVILPCQHVIEYSAALRLSANSSLVENNVMRCPLCRSEKKTPMSLNGAVFFSVQVTHSPEQSPHSRRNSRTPSPVPSSA